MVGPKQDDRWPPYHDTPKYSTFVLGVIGTQYARLEFAFGAVFTVTTEISSRFAVSLLPKISNDIRCALIEEALPEKRYSPEIEGCISHFLAGYKALAFNRNMVMHSQIVFGGATTTILLRTQRDGKTVGCQLTVDQLQLIADDMERFRRFGLELANCISAPRWGVAFSVETPVPDELSRPPDKPPLPTRLEYTSDPIPFR